MAGNPHLDVDGVLFTTAQNPGGYWNLWGNGAGSYSLWESVPGGGYPIQESSENLTVSPVPESPTWIMTLLGFAGLGFARYRRALNSRAALCTTASIA